MLFCQLVTFHNSEEVEMALREWLRIQDSDFYLNWIFKLVPGWGKCAIMFSIMLQHNDTSVQQISCI